MVLTLSESQLTLRGGNRLVKAVQALTEDMNLYEGVKFAQILEAVYEQGRKDGARAAFEAIDGGVKEAKTIVPYRNPGRPRGSRGR